MIIDPTIWITWMNELIYFLLCLGLSDTSDERIVFSIYGTPGIWTMAICSKSPSCCFMQLKPTYFYFIVFWVVIRTSPHAYKTSLYLWSMSSHMGHLGSFAMVFCFLPFSWSNVYIINRLYLLFPNWLLMVTIGCNSTRLPGPGAPRLAETCGPQLSGGTKSPFRDADM